jgi:hypothetical protein
MHSKEGEVAVGLPSEHLCLVHGLRWGRRRWGEVCNDHQGAWRGQHGCGMACHEVLMLSQH